MPDITLTVRHGHLCTPLDAITDSARPWYNALDPLLVFHYDAGDFDLVDWPHPDVEHLGGALFDAREMGLIPNVQSVRLPDGTEFTF